MSELLIKIEETEATIAKLEEGLRAAAAELRENPLEVTVEVFHDHEKQLVKKPHPALRRYRELLTTIRAAERSLARLKEQQSEASKMTAPPSRWARFAPKPRENEVQ